MSHLKSILQFNCRMIYQLLIIFTLGFSSGLPMALVGSTLQAWFASSGQSIMLTGMISLLSFPYAYRMIWAPFLDHYSLSSLGRRRSWLIFTQIFLLIGFNIIAWYSPMQYPKLIMVISLLLSLLSATQDAVIDAHRTEYLPATLYGIGATLAVFGYRIAMLISGGVALLMAHRLGFATTYRILGLFMLPGILATLLSKEPQIAQQHQYKGMIDTFSAPVNDLFSRPRIFYLLFFIFFYKLGEAFTTTTGGVMMPFLIQGIGFPLDTIGVVNKVIGVVAILLGGMLSGVLLVRWSLYKALLYFGILQAITNLLFVLLSYVGKNVPIFVFAVVSDNFAAGMGATAIVVLFMRLVNKNYTATQFSILVACATLPRIISGPFAAWLQSLFGWIGVFELSFIFALCFLPFLYLIKVLIENSNQLNNGAISTCSTTIDEKGYN